MPLDEASQSNETSFRILSLDGGGIRGAFAVAFLAELEKQLGGYVAQYFDLIAGTSTGAIIAGALALGEPAEKIERLYRGLGPQIFSRPDPPRLPLGLKLFSRFVTRRYPKLDEAWLLQAKYTSQPLSEALQETFGARTFEQAQRRLLIPAVDLTHGGTVVFKTPHMPGLNLTPQISIVDAVLASTAAPAYFPHVTAKDGNAYCDGTLWANNPALVAYAEAASIRERCTRPEIDPRYGLQHVQMLSIGSGTQPYFAKPPGEQAGLLWWAPRLLDVVAASHSVGVHFQASCLMGDRYTRVNFKIPGKELGLDSIDMLDQLTHLGREKAVQHLGELKPRFFSSPAPAPKWFPAAVE